MKDKEESLPDTAPAADSGQQELAHPQSTEEAKESEE